MTRYRWSSQDGTRYDWEEVENMTPSERMTHFSQLYGGKVEFTKDGMEQLQEDVITFLDQFDEMPQQLVDEICQVIVDYYNKHRPSSSSTPLNPSGDHKTL